MPTPTRPFRFAVELTGPFPDRTWADTAKEVEALGYSTLFVPDHFDEGLGPIAAITVAGTATTTLKVGALVFDCDFRHPAVLARELTSIDQFTGGGRLEVGLGAGWKRLDYQRSGIPMDRPGVRVSRMIEYTRILRALFAGDAANIAGEHFTITDLAAVPAAVTPPPILIGGGAPRVLGFAGANADIVVVNSSIASGEIDVEAGCDALPDRIDRKLDWVREGAGDRYADVEINAWLAFAEVTDHASATADLLAGMFNTTPDGVLASPVTLVGSPGEIEQLLQQRRERWDYSYTMIPGDKARDFAQIVTELTGS